MKEAIPLICKLLFRRIYLAGLGDGAKIAQNYACDIIDRPKDSDPPRAATYSHVAQQVAALNVANLIRDNVRYWESKRLWPIKVAWRWRDRQCAKLYDQYVHTCDGYDHKPDVGWVLHLGALKLIFG